MEFRTVVDIDKPSFQIEPCEEILFVGSCFADAIGARFREEAFPVTVNPYGVMYNPASILHTLQRLAATSAGSVVAASPAGSVVAASPAVSGLPADISTTPAAFPAGSVSYFPAYELVLDELRDYRFYAPDMLHPSAQAVDYIWERLVDSYFSPAAKDYLAEWRPLKQALAHKPFNPDSPDYRAFHEQTLAKVAELQKKYPHLAL